MRCRWLAPLASPQGVGPLARPIVQPMPSHPNVAARPSTRPSRVVVEAVAPLVDGGAFPAKATIGEPVTVTADVFTDGHDRAAAALRVPLRPRDGVAGDADGRRSATTASRRRSCPTSSAAGSTRSSAGSTTSARGATAWSSSWPPASTSPSTCRSASGCRPRARHGRAATTPRRSATCASALEAGDTRPLGHLPSEDEPHHLDGHVPDLEDVEPEHGGALDLERAVLAHRRARPGRRAGQAARRRGRPGAGPLQRVVRVLPPLDARAGDRPRHAGRRPRPPRLRRRDGLRRRCTCRRSTRSARRSARAATTRSTPSSDDTGSPWAIGAPDGGHTAVHPELGTVDDVVKLAAACRERGIELALDIAFQCTPDHPWVTEHPTWFAHRPDGTIQYAENPPKKYQDIYPLDFESEDWQGLWTALADVIRFWIDAGVTIVPRRQPAHQGVRLLGVGDRRRSAASTPRRSSSPRRSPGRA